MRIDATGICRSTNSRDVIEEMLPGDLDVSGWELRKTLRLVREMQSGAERVAGLADRLRRSAGVSRAALESRRAVFNPIAATHHYRKMAERALEDNYRDGRIGIKKIFYVLRPLLACRWIESDGSQPPTEFSRLTAAPWVT